LSIKRNAAPGVDEQTWQQYGENLEVNLQDLSERLKRGAYQAKPVKRLEERPYITNGSDERMFAEQYFERCGYRARAEWRKEEDDAATKKGRAVAPETKD